MNRASELSILTRLFADNGNVDMLVFTKLFQRVSLGLETRLLFDNDGVSLEFKGQKDNLLLHRGAFVLDLAKERKGED